MPQIIPCAVLVAFLMNAASWAMAVDNAQFEAVYLEPGHRGDPGPAQVELLEASGADEIAPGVASTDVAIPAATPKPVRAPAKPRPCRLKPFRCSAPFPR